jgi:hypothetical protein
MDGKTADGALDVEEPGAGIGARSLTGRAPARFASDRLPLPRIHIGATDRRRVGDARTPTSKAPPRAPSCNEIASRSRAAIAIRSTVLGPATGGLRMWTYPDEQAAISMRSGSHAG